MNGGGFVLEIDGRRLPMGEPRIVVGRDPGCDVVVDDPSVSTHHARFERSAEGRWILIDDDSTNGTLVGGMRMRPGVPRLVTAEAEIRFGTVRATVRAPVEVTAGVSTVESAMAMLQALGPSQEQGPTVYVVEGAELGRQISLGLDETAVVGRSTGASIVLSADPVSLRHLEIRRTASGVLVRDAGSRHGSELAGRRLPQGDWSVWEPGTCLSLARSVVVLMLERERTVDDLAVKSNPFAPKVVEPVPPVVAEVPVVALPLPEVVLPAAPMAAVADLVLPVAPREAPRAPSWVPWLMGGLVLVATLAALGWLLRG